MVFGRSCSCKVSWELVECAAEVVGGGRGTRLYFVLLGWMSAESSSRNEWSSFSAISSRESGVEGGGVGVCSGDVCGEGLVSVSCLDGELAAGVDHSQPILSES